MPNPSSLQPELSAVTAFYDVGRVAIDGRTREDYLLWLNRTLQLPVDFTIFLDPRINPKLIASKPGDTILQPDLEEFRPFSTWRQSVHEICRTSTKIRTRRDIAILLPDYGLLVHCKMYMLQRVAQTSSSHNLLWLDAGMSRFYSQDLATARVDEAFLARFADAPMALHIAPKFRRPLQRRHLSPRHVGEFDRLITAGDMLFSRQHLDELVASLTRIVETDWLPNELWDNEQTALGYVMVESPASRVVGVSKGFGDVAEQLFGGLTRAPRKHSTPWQRLKWHFGKTAPVVTPPAGK